MKTQTGFSLLIVIIILTIILSLLTLFIISSIKITVQNNEPLRTPPLTFPTVKPSLIPDKPNDTPLVSPLNEINPATGWKIYNSKKYAYTLSFPPDWQLNEAVAEGSDRDVNVDLNNKNKTGDIFLTAAPEGHGCFFMQGPNPNLIPRIFKIGNKSVILKDDCFEKKYLIRLKDKTGESIYVFIIAKDEENYKIAYKILESIQGLELTK